MKSLKKLLEIKPGGPYELTRTGAIVDLVEKPNGGYEVLTRNPMILVNKKTTRAELQAPRHILKRKYRSIVSYYMRTGVKPKYLTSFSLLGRVRYNLGRRMERVRLHGIKDGAAKVFEPIQPLVVDVTMLLEKDLRPVEDKMVVLGSDGRLHTFDRYMLKMTNLKTGIPKINDTKDGAGYRELVIVEGESAIPTPPTDDPEIKSLMNVSQMARRGVPMDAMVLSSVMARMKAIAENSKNVDDAIVISAQTGEKATEERFDRTLKVVTELFGEKFAETFDAMFAGSKGVFKETDKNADALGRYYLGVDMANKLTPDLLITNPKPHKSVVRLKEDQPSSIPGGESIADGVWIELPPGSKVGQIDSLEDFYADAAEGRRKLVKRKIDAASWYGLIGDQLAAEKEAAELGIPIMPYDSKEDLHADFDGDPIIIGRGFSADYDGFVPHPTSPSVIHFDNQEDEKNEDDK